MTTYHQKPAQLRQLPMLLTLKTILASGQPVSIPHYLFLAMLIVRVSHETRDYKMTTYMRNGLVTFTPKKGKKYQIKSECYFSPLLNPSGSSKLPFSLSSSVTDVDDGNAVKVLERRRNYVDPCGCKRQFDSFSESEYVFETVHEEKF